MTKAQQRTDALARRAALDPNQRRQYSEQICLRLLELPALQTAHTVFSYLATEEEVDLTFLHERLTARGVKVAFPVTEKQGHMEAYVPNADDPLLPTRYGIREPDPSASLLLTPDTIDVVLAPCVAFDPECRRLGHGGGYYDRWLARAGNIFVIAAAFEAQKAETVYTDVYDIPADMVVTEHRVYTKKAEE